MPWRNAINVGIDSMPAAAARPCCSSVLILPNTMSSCTSDAASKIGPNMRHGGHQVAHQSRNTISLSARVDSMSASVMVTVAMRCPSVRETVYPLGYPIRTTEPKP